MSKRKTPPSSARILSQWVDVYARGHGLPPKRIRDWISYMVLSGHLTIENPDILRPRFTLKGAVALEMRLPFKARATRDIDLVVEDSDENDPVSILRKALEGDYQGFTFRVKGEVYVMPNNAVRASVTLDYHNRSWGTVQVDLSSREGAHTEIEFVDPLPLEPFGLVSPDPLPCLSIRYHIAQKIHAMTAPPFEPGTPNERFRDLVDILLMKALAGDLGEIKDACEHVFSIRGIHEWPPAFEPPEFWKEPFAVLAEELNLPVRNLADAVREVQAFITEVDATLTTD